MSRRTWWPLAASLCVYVAATAILGRDVLAHLSTHVANDPGDPLLTAAILQWNATHVPWSDAWWQLPIFYPTRDALAFSEHLLGLSVVATPVYWLTRDVLVTYNLVTLLTFPLCAVSMYALVFRLTRSAAGAFIAGLAFGFAPYRISQLPHIQILAAFWAPLALLGLHAYLESGRRRWLALYGATWALQAAANGYALFFFSALVGLWVLWFVIARGNWKALGMIAVATLIASIPLTPVLYKYATVHARHGFVRSVEEVRIFSADVAGVLCAPPALTFWGWVRAGCRPEGELFPGAVAFALFVIGVGGVLRVRAPAARPSPRAIVMLTRILLAVGVVYAAVVASVLWLGRWQIEIGPLHASASSVRKPLLVCLGAFVVVLFLLPGVRTAIRQGSTLGFYVLAALVTWLLTLGPTITFMGVPTGTDGPFAWLMWLPGVDGLRAPSRFWLMTMICLAVVAGVVVAELTKGLRPRAVATCAAVLGCGVLADGWVARIVAAPAPSAAANPRPLQGATVIELPVGDPRDIAAQFRAITGGWRSVNGYSGYGPSYYPALGEAVRQEVDGVFRPFQAFGELDVVVPADAKRLTELVERQPGVTVTGRNAEVTQYRLPRVVGAASAESGSRTPIATLRSACAPDLLRLATDDDPQTRWVCFSPNDARELVVDLGSVSTVGTVMHGLGPYDGDFPRELSVETSVDGTTWEAASSGSVIGQAIAGAIDHPRSMRIALPFTPRLARFVRLRHPAAREPFYWSLAELEVWSGGQ